MVKWFVILVALLVSIGGFSQNLSGIWKGFFTTGFGDSKQYYKYEAQILLEGASNALSGISYSYLNPEFYGKSQLDGYYNTATKKIDLRESKLISFSNTNSSNVCLMHCTLSYFKVGNDEVLEGTFSSSNSVTGADCGQGYIHLERSAKSDFYTEPFLAKTKKKAIEKSSDTNKPEKKALVAKNNKMIDKKTVRAFSRIKVQLPVDSNHEEKKVQMDAFISSSIEHNASDVDIANPVIKTFASIPEYFQKRKNKLVKTIVTHTPEVDISFYDNGEVDDDSITVYHNLMPIIQHGRLSRQSIDYGFDASDNNRLQSFIIVADNLGKIPPNSALMVVYTNHERYEIFIESDLKNNGEVRIMYEPVKKSDK